MVFASQGRGLAMHFMSCKGSSVGVVSSLGSRGDQPRSRARVAMPVGHGLGGVLPQWTRIGKLQNDRGRKHSRGCLRNSLARLARAKTRQVSKKGKESQARDGNSSNKTSNRNEQAKCRKQMK